MWRISPANTDYKMQTDIVLELTRAQKVNYVLDNKTFHESNYAEPNVCLVLLHLYTWTAMKMAIIYYRKKNITFTQVKKKVTKN